MRFYHRLTLADPHAHLVEVETTVRGDDLPSAIELAMPVWTPGSYLVREYARHVEGLRGEGCTARKIRKNAWRVERGSASDFVVRYRVYANDLTVRTNHVDATHIYVNGAATFLYVPGHEGAPVSVEIAAPEGWKVATALRTDDGRTYHAASYDELVDSPIEVGTHETATFTAAGKAHTYAIWPPYAVSQANVNRLVEATKTIVETEAGLFGGALPHDGYLFLLHISSRGRGGLEHLASSTLLAPPTVFDGREGWLDLLSLVAHEYFHLWNVKRIRPEGLTPYRYQEENYTRLLWWFEGATSYYDWRVLRLAKLCTVEEYLEHLAGEIAHLEQTPGRLVHPLEEASFDAWIKLYRPDENSANSTISYYRKGELVCALLDLEIRARTGGKSTLDHVLRHLWDAYGATGTPVPEDRMQSIFEDVTGTALGDLWDAWIRGAHEVDAAATFARAGLAIERTTKSDVPSLGARLRGEGARAFVSGLVRGAAGMRAGLDVGDELLAVDDRRVDYGNLDAAFAGHKGGDRVTLLVSREGRVRRLECQLDPPRQERVRLVPKKDAAADARSLCEAWLGERPSAWK
jgi:predicted metalloprotease with PDZ domain